MNYQTLYQNFLDKYKKNSATSKEAAEIIMDLTSCYMDLNAKFANTKIKYNQKYAKVEQSDDPIKGKPITSSKAKIIARASNEYGAYLSIKIELDSLKQCIYALKSLQSSLLDTESQL